jgi:radical SAM superfamily enzyme YgiQ (UPF0313 family)
MKITFIMPAVGRKKNTPYSRSWIMEPLGLAILSSYTPAHIQRVLYDDRLESIPYDDPTDIVAINVETYTAQRAYQIAAQFRKRKVKIVMGGYHATLLPEEVLQHADSVVIGEGEQVWGQLLEDFKNDTLKQQYSSPGRTDLTGVFADRSLFSGKNYFNLTLIETGRGCRFSCEFCSVNAFYKKTYTSRPVIDVIKEIETTRAKNIFFVDDNIGNDRLRAKELFTALIPLKINWISQISMHLYKDDELLDLMKRSGCRGVLIGFETMEADNLVSMGKNVNTVSDGYDAVVKSFHKHTLAIYGTFVFGYKDTKKTFQAVYTFAMRQKLFYAAFNHLVPFPGTQLYHRLESEGKLRYKAWWTDRRCHFGNVYFNPENMTSTDLEQLCYEYRYKFFHIPMILLRVMNFRVYWKDITSLLIFLGSNIFANRETRRRRMLPFGVFDE